MQSNAHPPHYNAPGSPNFRAGVLNLPDQAGPVTGNVLTVLPRHSHGVTDLRGKRDIAPGPGPGL